MKLFNLELKDNNPMKLAYEIRAIFHDIDATGVKLDIQVTAFIKDLYPTYTHYLESLQASGHMKAMTDPDGDQWPPTYSTGSKQLSIMAVS